MFGRDCSKEVNGLFIEGSKFLCEKLEQFVTLLIISLGEVAQGTVVVCIGLVRSALYGHFEES